MKPQAIPCAQGNCPNEAAHLLRTTLAIRDEILRFDEYLCPACTEAKKQVLVNTAVTNSIVRLPLK